MTGSFMGYNISEGGIQGDTGKTLAWIAKGESQKAVATINAHSVCVAEDDNLFKQALQKSDLLIPDGAAVVWASRFLGVPVTERVSGYDFFTTFSARANEKGGISYFFLGSSPEVLKLIIERVAADYPHIRIAGSLPPPFKAAFNAEENQAMIAAVNAARPDVLWVGMTAPKQEKWIMENVGKLDISFAASIGAVFDFYARTKPRAPRWMQLSGFEWLHRLLSEPKRVWKRYLLNNPRFVWIVLKNKLGVV